MTEVLKISESSELTEDFCLTVPIEVQQAFENFELEMVKSKCISVDLQEYQAHLFLRWLAFKGYPCETMLKQDRIKIIVEGQRYSNFSFLKYAQPMEMKKATFSPMFINKFLLCREIKTFFSFLNFKQNEDGSYEFNPNKQFKFSYQDFFKFMGRDTLHMIRFLHDNCYISMNNTQWLNLRKLPPKNLTFKLSSKFFLKLMATEPTKNSFELFLIEMFDSIFSIKPHQYSEVANAA